MSSDSFKITDRRSSHDSEKPTDSQVPVSSPEVETPSPVRPAPPATKPAVTDFPENEEMPADALDDPQTDPTDSGQGGGTPFSMRPIEIAHSFIGVLAQKGWVSLGLMPNPETGAVSRNLEDAGETIELLEVLVKHFSGKWRMPGLETEIQNQLSNLRLQFARLKG